MDEEIYLEPEDKRAADELAEYDFRNVMRAAVKLFGHDSGMQSCKDAYELVNNIGGSEVPRLLEELQRSEY